MGLIEEMKVLEEGDNKKPEAIKTRKESRGGGYKRVGHPFDFPGVLPLPLLKGQSPRGCSLLSILK